VGRKGRKDDTKRDQNAKHGKREEKDVLNFTKQSRTVRQSRLGKVTLLLGKIERGGSARGRKGEKGPEGKFSKNQKKKKREV